MEWIRFEEAKQRSVMYSRGKARNCEEMRGQGIDRRRMDADEQRIDRRSGGIAWSCKEMDVN